MNIIETMKEIVKTLNAKEINDTLIDVQTANAIITVYEKLGNDNRKHFLSLPVDKMAQISWKLLTR